MFLLINHHNQEETANPPRLPRYFGLLVVNSCKLPLPLNKPYHQPLNYLEYVKDFDPYVHIRVLKLPLEQMVKQKMQKLLICLVLPSEILCLTNVTIAWEITYIVLLKNCS
jgi:hypothetical protein